MAYGGMCGTSAYWEFVEPTGTLRIYGTGDMYGYDAPDTPMPSPWATYTNDITSIVIEEGITGLGHFAFSFTPITSITIPSTVTFIGTCTFQSCTSLTEIIFLGEQPEMVSNAFFITDWIHNTVSATIYSNGWASDEVFTTDIKGTSNITFTYKTLGGGAVTIPVNVNGTWMDATPYANVNGVWKEITVYMNVNGMWKEGV